MNNDTTSEIRSLAAGVRAVSLTVTLLVCYFNVRMAFRIGTFQTIFTDMLGGKPLPSVTTMILQGRTPLIILSLIVPVAAIFVVARIKNHKIALYWLTALMILSFIQIHFMWIGLLTPLMSIISSMQNQ